MFHTDDCISSGDTEFALPSEMDLEFFLFFFPMIKDNGLSALCGYPMEDNNFVLPDVQYACEKKRKN